MCRKASKGFRQGLSPRPKWFLNAGDEECGKGMLLAHQGREMSQFEIGGDKPCSRHLFKGEYQVTGRSGILGSTNRHWRFFLEFAFLYLKIVR